MEASTAFVAVPSAFQTTLRANTAAFNPTYAAASPPALRGSSTITTASTYLCIACVASVASASQRKSRKPRTTALAFESELGVTLPVGYWDPLNMSADGDIENFRRRREAEIKNGRVAMIASIGYILPEYVRWPGEISPSLSLKFQNIPSGLAALYKIPAEGWAQIGVLVGFLELFPMSQDSNRAPGDYSTCGKYGIPWFYVAGKHRQTYSVEEDQNRMDPVTNQRSLNAEINNGRLAMFSIVGMVMQNAFIGTTGPDMWIP